MSSETPSRNTQSDPPLITASVAGVFAGFGIIAAIGLGWAVARSTAGLAPFSTAGGAADWIVNDIKIGNRSQFSQAGDVPGDMFANTSIDSFVTFETAQTAMDVFTNGEVDRVMLVYNEFRSVISQKVIVDQLLPIPRANVDAAAAKARRRSRRRSD